MDLQELLKQDYVKDVTDEKPSACSPGCIACKIGHNNKYNAIMDSSGGYMATYVEGKMRWKTKDGPGAVVTNDTFSFVQVGHTFLLYPQDIFASPGVLRNGEQDQDAGEHADSGTEVDEGPSSAQDPSVLLSNLTDEELRDIIRAVQAKGGGGSYLPDVGRDTDDKLNDLQTSLDVEFYKRLLLSGNEPRDTFIAIDNFGQMDVDYDNAGPELNPVCQVTASGYLSTFNEEEIAEKRRQRRLRMLASLPVRDEEDTDQQGAAEKEAKELNDAESVSSVSDISVDQDDPDGGFTTCDGQCWSDFDVQEPTDGGSDVTEESIQKLCELRLATLEPYVYQGIPAGYTRILEIRPGTSTDQIECSLISRRIVQTDANENCPETDLLDYEALSYTWGGQASTDQIVCDGRFLLITPNLRSALRELRRVDHSRYLWVDAVGINQADVAEKNEQIPMMMDIYKQALNVIVWLGSNTDSSSLAVETMKYLDTVKGRHTILNKAHVDACLESLQKIYEAQSVFFSRPWFRRTWIRQELIMAKSVTVVCGSDRLSWNTMKRSVKRLDRLHRRLSPLTDTITPIKNRFFTPITYLVRGWVFGESMQFKMGDIRSIWYYHTGGLLDLLMVGREFEATDPRDKIYSILGLARVPMKTGRADSIHPRRLAWKQGLVDEEQQKEPEPFEIEYSRSVPDTFQYLAKYIINRDRNLDILGILTTHRTSSSADLPSWTPDWRVPTSEVPLGACADYWTTKFGAAGFTAADAQIYEGLGKLRVQGWPVDVVEQLLPLSGDLPHPPLVPQVELHPFDAAADLRRVARSTDGRTAIVPRDTVPGDEVYILKGSRLPFVLRFVRPQNLTRDTEGKIVDWTLKFQVVGPCWVPDLMYGKAVAQYEERRVEALKIVLV